MLWNKGDSLMFLSVITVTLNCVETIERTIESVLHQKNDEIEYILIDGGSTDGTKDIIKKYDKEITYWVSEPDNGIYDAMNKGIRIASGEFVAFINGNDWYEKNIFKDLKKAAITCKEPIFYGYVNAVFDGEIEGYVGISHGVNIEELHFYNLYCHQGLFIRRKMFSLIGNYDTAYKIYADYDWILKAHQLGYEPYLLNKTVANFTMGGISESGIDSDEELSIKIRHYRDHEKFPAYLEKKRGKAEYMMIKKKIPYKLREIFNSFKTLYLWGLGKYGIECFEMLSSLGINVQGIILTTSPDIQNWNNIPVLSSEEIFNMNIFADDLQAGMLIATEDYEEEIVGVLEGKGIDKNKYICMSQLYKWSYDNFYKCGLRI